jgi:integrase/recombinase XerD
MHDLLPHIEEYLVYCKLEKTLSELTLRAYENDLSQFAIFIKHVHQIDGLEDIDKEIFRSWLRHILQILKPKSAKRKMASVNAFFNHLEYEEIIVVNPLRKTRIRIDPSQDLPIFMSLQEVNSILSAAYSELKKRSNLTSESYRLTLRDIAVLEVLFATGIRVSELCGLRDNGIDLNLGTILVDGKGSKQRQAYIPHQGTVLILRRYKDEFKSEIKSTGNFFVNRIGKPLQSQSVRHLVKKYVKITGISKPITPHTFRHTFATLLLDEGVDIKYIQQFLGHSSIMTTQIYTHVTKSKKEEILKLAHPRAKMEVG